MIIRVFDEEKANKCDVLLTKLIQDERQYDKTIDKDFVVNNYFKNAILNKNNILLCYEENSIIKGYIYLKEITNNNKKGYMIDGIYVDEEYRQNGIAKALINESIKIINNTDAKFIDINVLANNKIARKIYESFGFNEFKLTLQKEL